MLNMKNRIDFFKTYCLLISIFATTTYSHAQTAEEIYKEYFDNWYQVEIIVFERIQSASADAEAWPKNIALEYPDKLQFFTTEDEATEEQDIGLQLSENAAENSILLEKLKKAEGVDSENDPLNRKIIDSIKKSELERITPTEKPFIKLDTKERNMNGDARVLARNRSMRLLFHEAWRQPFASKKDAHALVISGGDMFDKNHELEGTITLYVARYLHINTNIWLTQFEANFGQEIEHWPIIPVAPEPPLLIDPEAALALNSEQDLVNSSSLGIDSNTIGKWNIGIDGRENTKRLNFDGSTSGNQNLLSDYGNLAQKPFLVKQIVKMSQKRRMRSGELHYLDHPRLGIIIKIDQYEPEVPGTSISNG